MSDTLSQSSTQTAEEDEKILRQWFADIRQMNEQILYDQERVVRLKIEANTLRGETQPLKAEARTSLARPGEPL